MILPINKLSNFYKIIRGVKSFVTFIPYYISMNILKKLGSSKMLKKILQLSTCLMMIFTLNCAKAELRDSDFSQGKCSEKMSVRNCVDHCKPQIDYCMKQSNSTAYACCKACLWPSEDFRRGLEWNPMNECRQGKE